MSFSYVEQAVSFSTVGGRRLIKCWRASNALPDGVRHLVGRGKDMKKGKENGGGKGRINVATDQCKCEQLQKRI